MSVAILALLLGGCGGHSAQTISTGTSSSGDGVTTRSISYKAATTTLQITFSTPQSDYPVGTPIPLNLTITNVGTATYTYMLCGLDEYATASVAPSGSEVWDSTYGTAVPTVCLSNVTLAPGESVSDQLIWKQNLDAGGTASPGTYTVNVSSGRLPPSDAAATIPALSVRIGNP